jgi:hypothetical protein
MKATKFESLDLNHLGIFGELKLNEIYLQDLISEKEKEWVWPNFKPAERTEQGGPSTCAGARRKIFKTCPRAPPVIFSLETEGVGHPTIKI